VRWTQAAGAAAVLATLSGCAVLIETRYPVVERYDVAARPAQSYYCYDCHGYRYFDPYYDWCAARGFRYEWSRHPEAVAAYRERYVRIKEQNPSYGRYRYSAGYRGARRYQEPRDYEAWRTGGSQKPPAAGETKVREKDRSQPGIKRDKVKEKRDPERHPAREPRQKRPPGMERPGNPGGA